MAKNTRQRALSIRNIYDKRYKTLTVDGDLGKAFGTPEYNGIWLVYGVDKNGKTWFSLKLAEYLTKIENVLYVSAEEGAAKAFRDTCQRIGIDPANRRLRVLEYTPLEELEKRFANKRMERIVFIDNITIYRDELKGGKLYELTQKYPEKLFVYIAHEERNAPYTATAKLAKRLAKLIVQVKGLTCFVSGRCPGGVLTIDEAKSQLFWGYQINNDNNE